MSGKGKSMGKKWGRNEDIQIGDIFYDFSSFTPVPAEYYQVTALRGKTLVELHAIHSDGHFSEGGHWVPTRPIPGCFMDRKYAEDFGVYAVQRRGQTVLTAREEITARVMPEKTAWGMPLLRELEHFGKYRLEYWFWQTLPQDWAPWDPKDLQMMKDYYAQCNEVYKKRSEGDLETPWPKNPREK